MKKILRALLNVGFAIILFDGDVKVGDHCHISGKYRGPTHKDCNTRVKLNHKILIAFHNLKNYDAHLILEEFGKFECKINGIPSRFRKLYEL